MDHNDLAPAEGLYFHTYEKEDDDVIGYQGRILGVKGARVRVQLFSWRTGQPADVATFSRSFFAKRCRLYSDRETWRTTGEAEKAATPYWRRWNRTRKPIAGIPA